MTTPNPIPIYTIGYGDRSLDAFLDLLEQHKIEFVIDVRSAPYSRFKPEFSKAALERALAARKLRYLFLGDMLGGRPDDPTVYIDGKVDYEAIKTKAWYQTGIERLETAFNQQRRVALMCSEGKPEQCHRSKLLAASLLERNVAVMHIDETGDFKSQDDVLVELTGGQLHLFGETSFTSRKRYTSTTTQDSPGAIEPDDTDRDEVEPDTE